MASKADAERALFGAIKACAVNAEKTKSGDLLKKAAEAFREVAHGPSGGQYDSTLQRTAHDSSTSEHRGETTTTHDYHETRHAGEDREKPPTGFHRT